MKTFEETLVQESGAWVQTGLITAPQREAILRRHPVSEHGSRNRFLAVLASVGGALFVVGVSLVIKANWDQIGDWVKIGGLVLLLVGTYGLGAWLKISPGRYPRLGDACMMVGSVLFLLGIVLVSQIFHLNSRPPNGVLLWWVGIVAIPWLVHARGAQVVSLIAGLTWLGMEFVANDSWLQLSAQQGGWGDDSFFVFSAAAFLLGAALVYFGMVLRRGPHEDFAGLHEHVGVGLMCWALYALGFTWSAHSWSHHTMYGTRWQPVSLLTLAMIGCGVWAFVRDRRRTLHFTWLAAPGIVPVAGHLLGIELTDSGWLWGGLACVALFLFNLGMIRVGLIEGREDWINLGMVGIALNIITRYFLLFGTMLEGGVFFIVSGLLVLGLGFFLERRRRALVKTVRKEVVS